VEEIVFLFTWGADATNRAPNQHSHAYRHQNGGQKVTQARQMIQQIMHFKEPHIQALFRKIRVMRTVSSQCLHHLTAF
jgi:hypothetical protein